MQTNKRNAIIMAAGTSSRFIPLSLEIPKGLLEVNGEVLIERQIRQLYQAGVNDITIVVGYKAEMFDYLKKKYGVTLVLNEDFDKYNNTSSLIRVLDKLGDTYICSSDNYFPENVFIGKPETSFYSALYAEGETNEYCLHLDKDDYIDDVTIGGRESWYMVGHVYFSDDFSQKFKLILAEEYADLSTRQCYWEDVYIKHIHSLPKMKIYRYACHAIEEFDSIDELRQFDKTYIEDTRSAVIKHIASVIGCRESELGMFTKLPSDDGHTNFSFQFRCSSYRYSVRDKKISRL